MKNGSSKKPLDLRPQTLFCLGFFNSCKKPCQKLTANLPVDTNSAQMFSPDQVSGLNLLFVSGRGMYTWVFLLCVKFLPLFPKPNYQKANMLHIYLEDPYIQCSRFLLVVSNPKCFFSVLHEFLVAGEKRTPKLKHIMRKSNCIMSDMSPAFGKGTNHLATPRMRPKKT